MNHNRKGNAARRKLEFDVIRFHVKKDKEAFIKRLQRQVHADGNCLLWTGSVCSRGYGRDTFRYMGKRVTIHAHRIFLILKLGRPIKLWHEAGHTQECTSSLCVLHVAEQHYVKNLEQEHRGNDLPF